MSAVLTVITLKHGKFKTEQLCFINLNVSKHLLLVFCVILNNFDYHMLEFSKLQIQEELPPYSLFSFILMWPPYCIRHRCPRTMYKHI